MKKKRNYLTEILDKKENERKGSKDLKLVQMYASLEKKIEALFKEEGTENKRKQ